MKISDSLAAPIYRVVGSNPEQRLLLKYIPVTPGREAYWREVVSLESPWGSPGGLQIPESDLTVWLSAGYIELMSSEPAPRHGEVWQDAQDSCYELYVDHYGERSWYRFGYAEPTTDVSPTRRLLTADGEIAPERLA